MHTFLCFLAMFISVLSLSAQIVLPSLSSSSSFFVSVQCILDPCVQTDRFIDTDINHPLSTLYLLDCKMYKVMVVSSLLSV